MVIEYKIGTPFSWNKEHKKKAMFISQFFLYKMMRSYIKKWDSLKSAENQNNGRESNRNGNISPYCRTRSLSILESSGNPLLF
jgi:hypothetical protein